MQERTTDPVSNKVEGEGWHSRLFFDCHMSAVTQPHSHTSYTYVHIQRKIKLPSSFVVWFCPWSPTRPHSDWIRLLAIVSVASVDALLETQEAKKEVLWVSNTCHGRSYIPCFRGVSLKLSNKIHLTSHTADILLLAHLWPLLFYCYVPHIGDPCCWHGAASLPIVSSCSVPDAGF